ncbi:hypothetical protein ACVWXU_003790 [Streptomyces sp. TE33382]
MIFEGIHILASIDRFGRHGVLLARTRSAVSVVTGAVVT